MNYYLLNYLDQSYGCESAISFTSYYDLEKNHFENKMISSYIDSYEIGM